MVMERFGASMQLTDRQLQTTVETSAGELAQVAAILRVNLKQSPFARQLKAFAAPRAETASPSPVDAAEANLAGTVLGGPSLGDTEASDVSVAVDASPPPDASVSPKHTRRPASRTSAIRCSTIFSSTTYCGLRWKPCTGPWVFAACCCA